MGSSVDLQPPFWRLPAHLRLRICAHAGVLGLERASLISLVSHPDKMYRDRVLASTTTRSLLLTCRVLRQEIASEVYSKNRFCMRIQSVEDFEVLYRLTSTSIRSLRWMTLHLNVASCGLGLYCDSSLRTWSIPRGRPGRDAPLSLAGIFDQDPVSLQGSSPLADRSDALIRGWQKVWTQHLLPNILHPDKLHLDLICDVEDMATGQMVVQPLLEGQSSRLAGCSVRLSHRKHEELQKLAETAVRLACGNTHDPISHRDSATKRNSHAFRFFDLPHELRQQILAYTDLVTPSAEVEWSRSSGLNYRYRTFYDYDKTPSAQYLQGLPIGYHLLADSFPPQQSPCWTRSSLLGCYCRARHSAASSTYQCDCWEPPTSLFLASRALRDDAITVFFSKNRFVVAPEPADLGSELERSHAHRIPALDFLTSSVSRPGLMFLRFLDLNFPPLLRSREMDFTTTGRVELEHWHSAIAETAKHLVLPKLTLRILFATWWGPDGMFGIYEEELTNWTYRHVMGDGDAETMRSACRDVLAPLRSLKGLRRFFVHFQDPLHPSFDDGTRASLLANEEGEMERYVTGSNYDAFAVGKAEEPLSDWMKEHALIPSETPDY